MTTMSKISMPPVLVTFAMASSPLRNPFNKNFARFQCFQRYTQTKLSTDGASKTLISVVALSFPLRPVTTPAILDIGGALLFSGA
jgi:hypothetical protein